jgi:bacterioferritin-associated ferredoxin
MMKKFKDFLTGAHNSNIDFSSVTVALNQHTLHLKFDSRDVVLSAGYTGPRSPWLSSLCYLTEGKTLNEISLFSWATWDEAFKNDQTYWDIRQEEDDHFFQAPLELLKASLDVFRGREYLYQESSPLICRCFGVRENDVVSFLKKENLATLDGLSGETKAGMGCRSCVPQLKRWLVLHESKKFNHHFKEKAFADWLLEIDYMLSCFPQSLDWKMEVQKMKGNQVSISFDKDVSQKEEEIVAKELQVFLAAGVDSDLGFFLRRARHFSKAKG